MNAFAVLAADGKPIVESIGETEIATKANFICYRLNCQYINANEIESVFLAALRFAERISPIEINTAINTEIIVKTP